MALRAKKPEKGRYRLKLLLFGEPKVGKTFAAAQFPQAYFIDTERGAVQDQYVEHLQAGGSAYLDTNVWEELVDEVRELLDADHEYRTLVIDPISTVYQDLVDQGERVKGTGWGAHLAYADARMKRLFLLLDRLDMNVLVTSHSKPEYKKNPHTGDLEDTGYLVADAWKKLPYAFDLLVQLRRVGTDRVAEIRGTRLPRFTEGERFEWSYPEFVARLGGESLEKKAEREGLVDADTAQQIRALTAELSVSPETSERWLKRARADRLEDLPADAGRKILEHLLEKRSTVEPGGI